LTNIIKTSQLLSKAGTKLILKDNFYETTDNTLVDVSYAINAYTNLTTINGNRLERISKLNRINEIVMLNKTKEQD